MINVKSSGLAAAAFLSARVAAHGHIQEIVINGEGYQGYDAPSWWNGGGTHMVIGWPNSATDNGFVAPDALQDPDIICHRDATPAPGHATVQAGDKISMQWNTWPDSHKGPVIDYLAKCPGDCESVDKTTLKFFKIDDGSYINDSETNGYWATDKLIDDNFEWIVQIPEDLEPGNYVLRHEIIALHSAGQENGAQLYPQCINLKVEGGGSFLPSGTLGTELYHEDDPGILYNLYQTPEDYTQPGPTLPAGLSSTVAQSESSATASATATAPGGGSSGGSGGGGSPTTTSSTPTQSGGGGNGGGGGGGSCASLYGQCGGQGWTGPTCCSSGSCRKSNDYYSQCL